MKAKALDEQLNEVVGQGLTPIAIYLGIDEFRELMNERHDETGHALDLSQGIGNVKFRGLPVYEVARVYGHKLIASICERDHPAG